MRHADLTAALALLIATSVHAVPARNSDFQAVQANQQASNNTSPPASSQQGPAGKLQPLPTNGNNVGPGQSAGEAGADNSGKALQSNGAVANAATGLIALPGAQVTAGQLQALPGAATESAVQSSVAAVETSSVLGGSESESATFASDTGIQLLTSTASVGGLETIGAGADAEASATSLLATIATSVASLETLSSASASIGGLETLSASASAEVSATSLLATLATTPTASLAAETSLSATASLGGLFTLSAGTTASVAETSLASLGFANATGIAAGGSVSATGMLQPLPGAGGKATASGSLVGLPTTFATASGRVFANSTASFASGSLQALPTSGSESGSGSGGSGSSSGSGSSDGGSSGSGSSGTVVVEAVIMEAVVVEVVEVVEVEAVIAEAVVVEVVEVVEVEAVIAEAVEAEAVIVEAVIVEAVEETARGRRPPRRDPGQGRKASRARRACSPAPAAVVRRRSAAMGPRLSTRAPRLGMWAACCLLAFSRAQWGLPVWSCCNRI
ncbi:hypothetical protein F5Y19DRAFT_46230 [Xylariaceae sp. FL1651]|nr:hypothetical protein F5Y19DRAFT_46230 [Xylariaceae sp. FL1651]